MLLLRIKESEYHKGIKLSKGIDNLVFKNVAPTEHLSSYWLPHPLCSQKKKTTSISLIDVVASTKKLKDVKMRGLARPQLQYCGLRVLFTIRIERIDVGISEPEYTNASKQ